MASNTQRPFREPAGLRVTVDAVVHTSATDAPPDRPHCFVYTITIHNGTEVEVTIRGRKWVVRNAKGETDVLEGDGVVGKFPCIRPGGHFRYQSRHFLSTETGEAEGGYLGVDADGNTVVARIPPFKMSVPR